jgi:hypothetical protein
MMHRDDSHRPLAAQTRIEQSLKKVQTMIPLFLRSSFRFWRPAAVVCVPFCLLAMSGTVAAQPLTPIITYQGELRQGGAPYNGAANLIFHLYSAPYGGTLIAGPLSAPGVYVEDGKFTVDLDIDLPAYSAGQERWLQISVNGTLLSPRQPLRAAPYANYALSGAWPFERSGANAYFTEGNVGIGTTNPNSRLEIRDGTSNTLFVVENTGTSGGADGIRVATSGSDGYGIYSRNSSPTGIGVRAEGSAITGEPIGLRASVTSPTGYAGYFVGGRNYFEGNVGIGTTNPNGRLEIRDGTSNTLLIVENTGTSGGADGIRVATSGSDGYGIYSMNSSPTGIGIRAEGSANTGEPIGLRASVTSPTGYAGYFVGGRNYFEGNVGIGTTNPSSRFEVRDGSVRFVSSAPASTLLFVENSGTSGGIGAFGAATATAGVPYGVYGSAGSNGHAVYAEGRMTATGTKAFQIDHPSDPENVYLNHYCAEGPEPLNVYSGNITLDYAGRAVVQLPEYFSAINRDVRYQLTPIGAWAPIYIARKVQDNTFFIAGGVEGMEVSWRIEAVRNDPYVATYGAPVEVDKGDHRGTYLHPELYGQPRNRALHYRSHAEPVQGR